LNSVKTDRSELLFILNNLGRLPANFDGEVFVQFLSNSDNKVRLSAVKNVAKLSNTRYLKKIKKIAHTDDNSMIRREAVSAIGRMRSRESIPMLLDMLSDPDPKVLHQVIRALMVFKNHEDVSSALKELVSHPNEMVQDVINKEFYEIKEDNKKGNHPSSPEFLRNVIVEGDVLEVLENVPLESIHLTFTSPPYYNARDYSKYPSYKAYLDFLESVFKKVYEVTKEGRFFILNTSPIIVPRISRQYSSKRYPIPFDIHPKLIKMGWEFVDDIVWMKPESSVKNRNAGFLQHRKPLAYKPNPVTEYLMVYRKKTSRLIDWNIRQYQHYSIDKSKVEDGYETSNVWKIDPTFDRIHSAVFPKELCHRIITYYSFIDDLVFDPFAGSGTLGKVALDLDRYFFLTEQDSKYITRIEQNLSVGPLFHRKRPKVFELDSFIKTVEK